jgi:hypothetical protein
MTNPSQQQLSRAARANLAAKPALELLPHKLQAKVRATLYGTNIIVTVVSQHLDCKFYTVRLPGGYRAMMRADDSIVEHAHVWEALRE